MNHDQQHIRRLIALDRQVAQLFNDFLNQVAPHLKRIKYGQRGAWSRNPVIERQLDRLLSEFSAKYKNLIQTHMRDSWELSEAKNDSTFMKLLKGTGAILSAHFLLKTFNRKPPGPGADPVTLANILSQKRNRDAAEAFMKSRLSETISPRVWNLVGENKRIILETVKSGILQGRSAAQISRDLRSLLNNPDKRFRRVRDPKTGKLKLSKPMASYHPGQGVYRSSYQNALRLARSEINMAYRRADLTRWQQNNFILGYEVKRSATEYDCDLCSSLTGKYSKNFMFVGWHPSCRCLAVPILPNRRQFSSYLETGDLQARPTRGIPRVAAGYIKKNSEKLLKMSQKPYWLKDNFTIKGGEFKLNIN